MKPWRDYLENILVAVFLALLVRFFVFTGYKVPTASMSPTLLPGDFIFSFRLPYGVQLPFMKTKLAGQPPLRGDVVVFTYPEQPKTSYVKRVVGLPGDVIKIEEGLLWVNGKKLTQAEVTENSSSDFQKIMQEQAPEGDRLILRMQDSTESAYGPVVVPPGEVFLMGDNRDTSDDSRYWGTVPLEKVEGRVVLIWFSLDWSQSPSSPLEARLPSVRWSRIFTSL